MNKMNKKGFTLIEMLVVIAIIAVLVSIIVPVVGNSTLKAQAATDAANLRSAAASISVDYLNGTATAGTDGTLTGYTLKPVPVAKTPTATVAGGTFTAKVVDGAVVCTFGNSTIADYVDIAEDGKKG